MSSRRQRSVEEYSDEEKQHERKKHKKSKKSSKTKHKDKDRDKQRKSDKDETLESGPELTAIEKFNMFKKQREAAKNDEGKVVDDLFKDFIASKIQQIEHEGDVDYKEKKIKSKSRKVEVSESVSELSKFLDEEISSIVLPTRDLMSVSNANISNNNSARLDYNKESTNFTQIVKSATPQIGQIDLLCVNDKVSVKIPLQGNKSSVFSDVEHTKDVPVGKKTLEKPQTVFDSEKLKADDKTLPLYGPFLPRSLSVGEKSDSIKEDAQGAVKKPAIGFKNFGIKLSATSAELIQSGEIHKKGKRLEDGEVVSSSSGEGDSTDSNDDEDNGSDGEISGTGSITDTDDKSSKSRKKKKKKGKHKKKKKSRDKDKTDVDTPAGKKEKLDSKRKVSTTPHSRSRSPKRSRKSKSRSRSRDRSRRSRSNDRSGSKTSKSRGRHSRSDRRSRSRSRSRGRRSRSRDRSRRSRSRGRRSRSKGRRSKSRSPDRFWRSKYGDFDAFKYVKGNRDRSRSRSGDRERDRERDRFEEKEKRRLEDLRSKIDKAKLREIAIQTALTNAKTSGSKLDVTIKAGGKSVEELTEYCKKIQEKAAEKKKYHFDSSSEEEVPTHVSDDDDDLHHPFKVKEAAAIKMDIPNSKQLAIVSPQERLANNASLRLVFPVSSGSQHRDKEWVPVEPTLPAAPAKVGVSCNPAGGTPAIMPPPPPKPEVKVFDEAPNMPVDIGAIVSERLSAVRKLQENPHDLSAKLVLNNAQKQASQWAQSKNLPGKFLGSTGATIMSQEELMGDRRRQAWLKKDVFTNAAPLSGGIGMFLLQKMGWKHGEGLGKDNRGVTEPIMLDFKVDRKGLVTSGEGKKTAAPKMPTIKDLSGKHPVSALGELCNKRRWGGPIYELVHESGPSHKKDFLFKVRVNNRDYQPSTSSNNKKLAKAQSATVCLQELGLVPR